MEEEIESQGALNESDAPPAFDGAENESFGEFTDDSDTDVSGGDDLDDTSAVVNEEDGESFQSGEGSGEGNTPKYIPYERFQQVNDRYAKWRPLIEKVEAQYEDGGSLLSALEAQEREQAEARREWERTQLVDQKRAENRTALEQFTQNQLENGYISDEAADAMKEFLGPVFDQIAELAPVQQEQYNAQWERKADAYIGHIAKQFTFMGDADKAFAKNALAQGMDANLLEQNLALMQRRFDSANASVATKERVAANRAVADVAKVKKLPRDERGGRTEPSASGKASPDPLRDPDAYRVYLEETRRGFSR